MDLQITTLPEEAESVDMRMIALGGGVSGKIAYLMEMGEEEDGTVVASFTLSNAPGVETREEAIRQHVEFVSGMLEVLQDALENDHDDDA